MAPIDRYRPGNMSITSAQSSAALLSRSDTSNSCIVSTSPMILSLCDAQSHTCNLQRGSMLTPLINWFAIDIGYFVCRFTNLARTRAVNQYLHCIHIQVLYSHSASIFACLKAIKKSNTYQCKMYIVCLYNIIHCAQKRVHTQA